MLLIEINRCLRENKIKNQIDTLYRSEQVNIKQNKTKFHKKKEKRKIKQTLKTKTNKHPNKTKFLKAKPKSCKTKKNYKKQKSKIKKQTKFSKTKVTTHSFPFCSFYQHGLLYKRFSVYC